ncbi:MAG: CoA pyrophosphatase [Myxococcota bacterium]
MTGNDLRRVLRQAPQEQVATRGYAAVAAIFDPNLDLLLIRRAHRPGDPWSEHLAFPGGRVEPDDPSPLQAAIRETAEEVGLDLSDAEPLGQLDDKLAVGGKPGLVIRPFVFSTPRVRPALRPNEEVADTFWRPLPTLLSGEGRARMTWRRGEHELELPCVEFDGQRLWGLTLAMIDDLLHRLDGGGHGLRRGQIP